MAKIITRAQEAVADRYRDARPRQLGDLHQRMRWVMEVARKDKAAGALGNDLWQALHDLQTEVSYHEPARPPFGKRASRPGVFIPRV